MDELPELPFEQVISYLNLWDRLKARAVSRRWYHKINSFQVKRLYYSQYPIGRIKRNIRWVSEAFSENLISSTRFATFFDTFGHTILSSLKYLRLCDLDLCKGDSTVLARTLNSFGKLEQLDIISVKLDQQDVFNLDLPMLTSLQLKEMRGTEKLTLEAPRLREVKLLDCFYLRVEIVHGESVEKLLVDRWKYTEVNNLENLKYLYVKYHQDIDPTLLSSLQFLKEIHTNCSQDLPELFEQKQRSGRADLKIYFFGLLLNDPDDPARNALRLSAGYLVRESFACFAENRSRLADWIPFYSSLPYSAIEGVAPGLEVDLLRRCTDLSQVSVNDPIQDIQNFFDLLENSKNIVELEFKFVGDQPQDLFDQLPEHCTVQRLSLCHRPSDLNFLFRLKRLIHLALRWPIDSQTVRKALEELPILSSFWFKYGQKDASIRISQSKQFQVWIADKQKTTVSDLNAAIEFITGNER